MLSSRVGQDACRGRRTWRKGRRRTMADHPTHQHGRRLFRLTHPAYSLGHAVRRRLRSSSNRSSISRRASTRRTGSYRRRFMAGPHPFAASGPVGGWRVWTDPSDAASIPRPPACFRDRTDRLGGVHRVRDVEICAVKWIMSARFRWTTRFILAVFFLLTAVEPGGHGIRGEADTSVSDFGRVWTNVPAMSRYALSGAAGHCR